MATGVPADPALLQCLAPARIACCLYQSACVGNFSEDKAVLDYDEQHAFCWGRNFHDMLGAGKEKQEVNAPVAVRDTMGAGAASVASMPELRGVQEVACGLNHMLFLVQRQGTGVVYGCGLGSRGRLAIPEPNKAAQTPATPSASSKQAEIESKWTSSVRQIWPSPAERISVRKVCCGSDHSLALTTDGVLYAWGLNQEGQCGVSHTHDVLRPQRVAPLTGLGAGATVAAFAAGGRHSLLVTGDAAEGHRGHSPRGLVYTWGCNQGGRLGNGSTANQLAPCLVHPLVNPRRYMCMVAGGESHSGAVDSDCNVWTWGVGSYGRLGIGESIDTPTPRLVSGVLENVKVVQLALGGWHSVALTNDGRLYSWGRGAALGLLPEGDSSIVKEPRLAIVPEIADGEILSIAAGTYHTLILVKSGEIFACGLGANGRLGLGDGLSRDSGRPVKVKHARYSDGTTGHPGFFLSSQEAIQTLARDRLNATSPATSRTRQAAAPVAPSAPTAPAAPSSASPRRASGAAGGQDAALAADDDPDDGAEEPLTEAAEEAPKAPQEQTFGLLQEQLRSQPAKWSEAELHKREGVVRKKMLQLLADIAELPRREAQLHLMETKFDAMFAKNLKFIKAGEPAELSGGGEAGPYMEHFEELAGVLQQQVAYLVSMAMCVESAEEQKVFYSTVKGVFRELEDDRTHLFFCALLRSLISKEIEQSKKMEDVFNRARYGTGTLGRDRSSSFHLLSHFALHEIHYKALVHPFMDHRRPGSLISTITQHCEQDEVWATTLSDYKTAPQIADKIQDFDPKEQQSEFQQSTARFQEFLEGDFVRCVKAIRLPMTLRKLLAHAYAVVRRRRFVTEGTDGLSEEQTCCMPILRFFVLGILVPMLRGAKTYAGRAAFLGAELERKLDQETLGLKFNVDGLAKYLELLMGHGTFDDSFEGRSLKKIGQWLQPVLMKYVMSQIKGVPDDIHTQLLIAVCRAHYDRRQLTVQLSTSTLMLLANLLRKNISKMSIKDNDIVARLCGDGGILPEFQAKDIDKAKEHDFLHVLRVDPRFMLKERFLSICPTSSCPVAPSVSTEVLPPGQHGNLVRKARFSEDKSLKILEDMFILANTDFESTSFEGLHKEVDTEVQENLKPGRTTGLDKLAAGRDVIAEYLASETPEAELFENLEAVMTARRQYAEYLDQLENGMRHVTCARDRHAEELRKATKLFEATNSFALSLKLPQILKNVAKEQGGALRLDAAEEKIANREEFIRSGRARDMASNAVVTHPLKKLLSKKVVVEILPGLGEPRDVRVTFHLRNGGVDITILLKRETTESIVQKVSVTEERLRSLKKAEAGETVGFPPERPLLMFSIAKLVDLLADTAAGR